MKPKSFSHTMRLMHWIMAILIIGMLSVGFIMGEIPDKDLSGMMFMMHKTIGVFVLLLLIARIIIRVRSTVPDHPEGLPKIHKILSSLSPYVLYFGMAVMAFSGYIMSDASGYGIELFGMIKLPFLLDVNKPLAGFANQMHKLFAWPLVAVVVLHISAALYHHYVLKNDILKGMLGR